MCTHSYVAWTQTIEFKGHSSDFTHEAQFSRHKEHYLWKHLMSLYKAKMSSVALEGTFRCFKKWPWRCHQVTLMTLQNEVVGFERSGHLGGREGLMTDALQLHYRKCRIQCSCSTKDKKIRISWLLLLQFWLFFCSSVSSNINWLQYTFQDHVSTLTSDTAAQTTGSTLHIQPLESFTFSHVHVGYSISVKQVDL